MPTNGININIIKVFYVDCEKIAKNSSHNGVLYIETLYYLKNEAKI